MLFKKRFNEQQLIEELKAGNEEALCQLYRDNYTTLRNYVMRNNGRPEDAEDLLQDAVIVVWENVRKKDFELTAKLSTFLFAVAKRMWLKRLNKNARIQYKDEFTFEWSEESEPINEKLTVSEQLLQQLDRGCREILTLFYFKDLDTQTIAKQLGFANTDVVKSRKYQCFKKLQDLFFESYNKSDFLD